MRPGFVLFLISVLTVTAATLAFAPLWSDALPLPNWYALAFSAGAIAVACGALYVNMQNLALARRREERDLAALEERRQREEREAAERAAKRLAWLAQFKELPMPPEARMGGRSFVYEWPAGWEKEAPERVWTPQTNEDAFWIMRAAWSVPGSRPQLLEPNRPQIPALHRFIYETNEAREWRSKVARGYAITVSGGGRVGGPMLLFLTGREAGQFVPVGCMQCWDITPGGAFCTLCGRHWPEVEKTNAEMLAQRRQG